MEGFLVFLPWSACSMHALLHSRCSRELVQTQPPRCLERKSPFSCCKVSGCCTCKARRTKNPAADTWEFLRKLQVIRFYLRRGCLCLNEAKIDLQVGRHLPMPGESSGESWWCSRRAWGELGELDPTQILKGSGEFGGSKKITGPLWFPINTVHLL